MGFKARRIKFRVYDRYQKVMHQVGSDHHDSMQCGSEDNEVYYYNYQNGEGSITYDESLPEDGSGYILMQYTGLVDKTGVEIYEGDIVQRETFGETIVGEIVWSDMAGTGFHLKVKGSSMTFFYLLGRGQHDDDNGERCNDKVIGNIYDDQELIVH